MTVKELNVGDFDDFIKEKTVVVDFWAPWCGPCKIMAPSFDEASEKVEGVEFAKVNVDENADLAGKFQVMSIPTTILFKKGDMVDRKSGAMSVDEIQKFASQ